MLFPKAILDAERAADAPLREAMAIKRERFRALRAKPGGNALPLASRKLWHLWGGSEHRMWGLGPWLADLPRDFSNRGTLLSDEVRCPGYNGAKPLKLGLWVIEGSMNGSALMRSR
jgi:hypothetical protein